MVMDGVAALEPQVAEREAMEHVWIHTATWVELAEKKGLKVFRRGEGARLYDVHGKEYIDGMSGLYVVNAGHGRREIGQAMMEQAANLAYVSSGSYTNEAAVNLAATVVELLPGDMDRLFFCSGGSEAVESAVKIAKQVQAMRGFPKRYKVIARRGGYHGATAMAMSLTSGSNEQYFAPFVPGVYHVPSPNEYRPQFPGLSGEADDIACANAVEAEIEFQGPETVAAVIAEPISVSNGTHVPAKAYWQRLREICDKHGVFLIADEVINGWGRSGAYFAIEHYGIVPDMMTMAKGLSSGYAPIAAVAVRPGVFEGFKDSDIGLAHLLTFGGHAVACAAASKNIEIFKREDLVQQSAEKGEYLKRQLNELRSHPTVGDVRGLGLMCAIDLVKDKSTKEKLGRAHPFNKRMDELITENGFITRVWDVMNVAPPFVITYEEIDRIVAITDEALTQAENEFASDIQG
jgi:adenosylmethionine-8-amino-7-oxononanoate aminotransferase